MEGEREKAWFVCFCFFRRGEGYNSHQYCLNWQILFYYQNG